jgi:hypothetical protein
MYVGFFIRANIGMGTYVWFTIHTAELGANEKEKKSI